MYWILVTFQYIQTLHTHLYSKNFQFAAIYYKENNGISNIWFLLWSVVIKLQMLMFVTTENWPVTIDQTECCRCHQCHLVTSSVFALCLTRGHCGKLYFGVNHITVNHNTCNLLLSNYDSPFSFVYFWQKSFHKLFYGEINNWRIDECPWLGPSDSQLTQRRGIFSC